MAEATDAQVQQYVNERLRVRAEQCRALLNALLDDITVQAWRLHFRETGLA